MALDAITISIDHIHEVDRIRYYAYKDQQQQLLSSLNCYPFIDLERLKYYTNKKNKHLNKYEKQINGIHFKYFPFLHKGYIEIKFNLPKLLYGYNIFSVYQYNLGTIWDRLCYELRDIIDLTRYPFIFFWKTNYYENNFDIIDSAENNAARLTVMSKTLPRGLNIDTTYADNGSIYFMPRNHKSSYRIIVYDKLKEFSDKSTMPSKPLINNSQINTLFSGQNILRVEIKQNRDKILRDFQPTKSMAVKANDQSSYLAYPMSKHIGSFGEVYDFNYQTKQLRYLINALHLNKKVLTRKQLINQIDFDIQLAPSTKKNIIHTIRYLNGELNVLKVSNKSLQSYKKYILDKGYHYIYSPIQLEPVSIDAVISSLNKDQINNINRYANKNIFQSFLL